MKLILFVAIFVSCSKIDKSKLEQPEFKELVGTWTTDFLNDEDRSVIIYKNGKVKIYKSTERGKSFRISEFKINPSAQTYNGEPLDQLILSSKINGKDNGSIIFYKKLNSNVAYVNFGTYIKGFELDTLVGISTKIYTRQ